MIKKQAVWETESYYHKAKEATGNLDHPALIELKRQISHLNNKAAILEIGCGDGSKLAQLVREKQTGFGIDVSKTAIRLAKKQYPQLNLQIADAIKLPFTDGQFDLVYSAFTLEHTTQPEQIIQEMLRVTKKGGLLALIAPNFGAPQRCSPCFQGSRLGKFFYGLVNDVQIAIGIPQKQLSWLKVKPKASLTDYEIDWDTTIEPYLYSLVDFLQRQEQQLVHVSSCWSIPEPEENGLNKVFRWLGKNKIVPFIYWGPHLFVMTRKPL